MSLTTLLANGAVDVAALIGGMSIEGWDGDQVPLMLDTYRKVQSLEGFAGLSARTSKRPAVGRDGAIVNTRYRSERQMAITGLVIDQTGRDPQRVWEEWLQIEAAFAAAVNTDRLLMWRAGDLYLQANVRLNELTNPVEVGPCMLRYQASLDNPSATAYDQTLQTVTTSGPASVGGTGLLSPFTSPILVAAPTGGTVAVFNDGGVPSLPLIVLRGGMSDPEVLCGDRRLVIQGDIAPGDELWLNAADRSVLLNGDERYPRREMLRSSVSRWFSIPPQAATLITLQVGDFDSSARIEVRFRNAY